MSYTQVKLEVAQSPTQDGRAGSTQQGHRIVSPSIPSQTWPPTEAGPKTMDITHLQRSYTLIDEAEETEKKPTNKNRDTIVTEGQGKRERLGMQTSGTTTTTPIGVPTRHHPQHRMLPSYPGFRIRFVLTVELSNCIMLLEKTMIAIYRHETRATDNCEEFEAPSIQGHHTTIEEDRTTWQLFQTMADSLPGTTSSVLNVAMQTL